MNEDEIRFLNGLCARAWAPLEWEDADGWVLRAARGFSLRANSVWAYEARGSTSLDARIEHAEAFYRARGLRPHFQLSPAAAPADLGAALQARGYETHTTTDVMVADVAATAPTSVTLEIAPPTTGSRSCSPAPPTWTMHAGDWRSSSASPSPTATLSPVSTAHPPPSASASSIAVGSVSTPCARRRPSAAVAWPATSSPPCSAGPRAPATRAYLQVETDNEAAIALYRGLGFARAYGYRYCSRKE